MDGRPCADRPLAAAAPAHHQALLAIDPEQALVVDRKALPPQQHMQPPIAEAAALGSHGLHALAQEAIVRARGLVADCHAAEAGGFTRPPFAHPVMPHEMGDSPALGSGRHFPSRSFSATLSSMASASMRFSLAFSSSSARSRLASDTSMPPNRAFHL